MRGRMDRTPATSNPQKPPLCSKGMEAPQQFPRSPDLMTATDAGLLVVDVQSKLIGLVEGHERIVWNIRRLIDGAKLLGVPVLATEQYPKGLGPTVPELAAKLDRVFDKTAFSCGACAAIAQQLQTGGRQKWLVCGIESHVCVQQ